MMKRNAVIRTAVASAVLAVLGATSTVAFGGTLTATARNVAQEAFGTAVTATTAVNGPTAGIVYTFATPGGIVINPGGTVYVTITPTGGKFATAAGAATNMALVVPTTAGGNLSSTSSVAYGSAGEIIVSLTNGGVDNTVLGVGASITVGGATNNAVLSSGAVKVTVVNALGLATGTAVTATGQVGTAAGTGNLEAASTAANLLTSSQAVTAAAVNSSAFTTGAETAKINLATAGTAGTGLIDAASATSQFNTLGSVTFSDSTTAAQELTSTAAVVISNATAFTSNTSYQITLASGTFTAGTTFSLSSAADCVAGVIVSTQTPTTVAATTTTVTLASAVAPVNGTATYVCATYPVAAITPYQPSIAGQLTAASTAFVSEAVTATSLYNLVNNGAVVDVNTYVPANDPGVFTSFIRVVNTGTVNANVSVALVNPVTGVATALGNLPSLAGGGAITYTSAQLEAATAAVTTTTTTTRPRLRFTAATNALKVQSFLYNSATQGFVEVSSISTGQ